MVDHFTTYSGTTAPVRIESIHRTQAEANAHAARNPALTALTGSITDTNVDVGWWITNIVTRAISSRHPPASEADIKAQIRVLAVDWGNRIWGHMRPAWVLRDGTSTFLTTWTDISEVPEAQRRYRNTYYWIMSGVGAVATACQDSGWTAAQCEKALAAFQALMPNDPERIHHWYENHDESLWTIYFTVENGVLPAHFHWKRDDVLPEFGMDAQASIRWDGAAGSDNPMSTVAVNATPASFATRPEARTQLTSTGTVPSARQLPPS